MLIRSLALATLFTVSAPVWAADGDSPLVKDRGHSRAVVVITRSSVDPDLKNLQAALKDPANQQGFTQRNLVLYTVADMIGKRNGDNLDAQATMALIRDLQLGVTHNMTTVLFGKDGQKRFEKDGAVTPQELFSAVDQLPAEEKNAAPAAAPAAAAEPGAAPAGKPAKGGKKAAEPLDD